MARSIAFFVLVAMPVIAVAQGLSGAIEGTVADAQHLALYQANVTLASERGRSIQTTTTDESGHYRFSAVGFGSYTVSVSRTGFASAMRSSVTVSSQEPVLVDLVLGVRSVQATVNVTSDSLTEVTPTGSRLDLQPLQTPASVNTITSATLETRGYTQIEDAVDSMPGVTSGGSPGDPSQFASRGFIGDQVKLLRDGVYIGPSNMISRPENSFNLQSVDLLKGPASVLSGQGAVGGTLNVITKPALFIPPSFDGYVSFGTFNTVDAGFGAGAKINDHLAFRSDISYYRSNGYVQHSNPDTLNFTGALLWKGRNNLDVKFAVDAMRDDLSSYYGTPLVPSSFGTDPLKGVIQTSSGDVLDARMRYKNYNVGNSDARSTSVMPSATLSWQPSENLTITNEFYFYHANRKWDNAETYSFIGANSSATDANGNLIPADMIARDRFHVYHQQNLPGDQLNVIWNHPVLGFTNKLLGGFEYSDVDFLRTRGFPDAQYADYVDPFNPARGVYGKYAGDFPSRTSPTKIFNAAGFFEDALDITHRLKLVTGIRFEDLNLDRKNYSATGAFQAGSSFTHDYHPLNVRAGAVYNLTSYLVAYGQFSTGQDPVGTNIFIVNAGENFKLASSRQGEVGLKSIFTNGRGDATLSVYDIQRKNILTQTALDVVTNVGSQGSKGVEFTLKVNPTNRLSVNFNTAYTHATFGTFIDPNSGINDAGRRPADVPATTTNLWLHQAGFGHLPLELGGGFRFVGARYADNADTNKLLSYPKLDLFGIYHLTSKLEARARIRNLLNKTYAQWADVFYPTEILLGAPRTYEVTLAFRF